MEPVTPSVGWGVTHLYFRVRPSQSPDPGQTSKELVAALEHFESAPDHQVLCSSVLGLKADLGVMALGPDLSRHEALARTLGAMASLQPVYSFFSMTELSEYMETLDDVRARLAAQGVQGEIGRRYTGRVLQLVTGATGLDDYEWGVTLLADDLADIKTIVYEMRFDEVTARYGPFWIGLTCSPADLPRRIGLAG